MANITIKLFENTAAAMVAEMRKMEARKGGIDQMLHGDGDSLNAAWGCSAVVLKTGEIQLAGAEATMSRTGTADDYLSCPLGFEIVPILPESYQRRVRGACGHVVPEVG